MLKKALKNKELAVAIVGQAISDEADVGLTQVKISLVSKEEAIFIWRIASKWKWANKFRRFADTEHKYDEWGFTLKSEKLKEIYDKIKPLPNKDKNIAFLHLIKHQGKIPKSGHGKTKLKILKVLIEYGPMTRRNLMYEVDIGYSTLKEHIQDLRDDDIVKIVGKNIDDVRHSHRRQADLWDIVDEKKVKEIINTGSF